MNESAITQLVKKNSQFYEVYFDNNLVVEIDADIIVHLQLFKGKVMTEEEIKNLQDSAIRNRVYNAALRYIGIRSRTALEVKNKLMEKEYELHWVQWAIEKLKQDNYINHELYAMQFTSDAIRLKKKGKKWIKFELKKRGIEQALIDSALAQVDSQEEADGILRVAENKWEKLVQKQDKFIAKQKLKGYLAQRGYSESAIQSVINTLNI
jgi:regulatory protein